MALPPNNDEAAGEIVMLHQKRRNSRASHFNQMETMKNAYNGGLVVAMPELDDSEKPAVANLMAQGIDQIGMRVASVMPNILYPALRSVQTSQNKAEDRRLANLGWWDMNGMQVKMRRRSRHLVAYGMSAISLTPVSVDPADKRQIPFWRVRDPLSTFPAQMVDYDSMEPSDCIFSDRRPYGWLKQNYPGAMARLWCGKSPADDDMFGVLEYMDADETVIIVRAAERPKDEPRPWGMVKASAGSSQEVLSRIPNKTGVCNVVIAGRVTLDRLQGQFDGMIGMYERAAKLDALRTIAIFRNVFPDEWIVQNPNAQKSPEIVTMADGKMGIIGQINGGQMQVIHPQQNQDVQLALDNLERAQRQTGLIPEELGGESGSNIRTARRGGQVLGSAIDMPIQELQEILAGSMEKENYRAVKIMKAYYGKKPSMFFMAPDGKVEGQGDYTPDETFEVTISKVRYALPGADINEMIVGIGQRTGMGTMSKETAMELDPLIGDPIAERDRVEIEGLNQALLTSIEQAVVSGSADASTVARIIAKKNGKKHMTLAQAVMEVHQEMQQEQAAQANAAPQPQVSPEAQPGIGVSPENPAAPPSQGAPPQLADLLASLHGPKGKNVPAGLAALAGTPNGIGGPLAAPANLQGQVA